MVQTPPCECGHEPAAPVCSTFAPLWQEKMILWDFRAVPHKG
ncbi:hypothetical protein SCOCK_130158 [Actinacidiphila cocklensis]|uniref:Uncharacterized protein n=1 Tax=Actinacidiphila cocklensis TaxID=887465 RepID=A0A9W4DI36_9ACTN|nr:hypothetical protein SCOCK_130158 [Actinacidiphila cocklensis]